MNVLRTELAPILQPPFHGTPKGNYPRIRPASHLLQCGQTTLKNLDSMQEKDVCID